MSAGVLTSTPPPLLMDDGSRTGPSFMTELCGWARRGVSLVGAAGTRALVGRVLFKHDLQMKMTNMAQPTTNRARMTTLVMSMGENAATCGSTSRSSPKDPAREGMPAFQKSEAPEFETPLEPTNDSRVMPYNIMLFTHCQPSPSA